jgi:DNA polymerase-3 subunit epsilon
MAAAADYPVAFNAEFDKAVMSQLMPESFERTWLCAMRDINWNFHTINAYGGYGLVPLALWLGIGVGTAHRAGDDVRLLVECFNRKKEQLPAMLSDAIALANSPYIELRAMVNYDNRHLASDAKFSWDGERKMWCKKIRECHYESFTKDLPFTVNILLPTQTAA